MPLALARWHRGFYRAGQAPVPKGPRYKRRRPHAGRRGFARRRFLLWRPWRRELAMFESLSDRLGGVFDRLRGRGALNETDIRQAMREVRVALLEADVALPVVRDFVDRVTEQAVGSQVLRSITPGQQVVKIVNDALVAMLGADASELELGVTPPAVIMMAGLQGSGKTTTTAKIAKRLAGRDRKKVLMASLDVNRPNAQEQLATLGTQAGAATLPT